ncbi:hypothetical protein [Mesorhizobium sp. M7A.F.Ca.MR.362.00.0.0]|uniref:hypothetical protein n=1 Tax=Mesorhizobium sp. M7A.F.Ca.MR.362.00.0.0 TaxID=2496779 RepID=UPI000FD601C5|nr:hypothetical protein [Mesorhizobium sp. M7A.F.Ca.MR.362.00.0.0]RUU80473.1 hypothetical protein EOC06_12015 [Mesorhizobium sp. M7A.F.Ca.MR.362.00.0.0]
MKLTEAQRQVLVAMADGHTMAFSRDGDDAWLMPRHDTGFLSDEQTIGLREAGYIKEVKHPRYDEGEEWEFHQTVITEDGRLALSSVREP